MLQVDDTIVAVASAPGGALRGIVRLSGPAALACLTPLIDDAAAFSLAQLRAPTALDVALQLSNLQSTVDACAYVWPTSASYTRQPTVELHLCGAVPLLQAVTRQLTAAGARLAGPGEFTLRAFLAGRIDLTQAEAVLGVIDAADRRQLESALAQLAGGLAAPLRAIRTDLLDLLADLEAGLDFVDEDIEFVSAAAVAARIAAAARAMQALQRQMSSRRSTASRPRVVLCGAPNVGKSSLLNALAGRAAALVSATPGATRDYLTVEIDFDGVIAQLVDTAGLDDAGARDEVQRLAQDHSRQQQATADLLLICHDVSCRSADARTAWHDCPKGPTRLLVHTKCDLPRAHVETVGAWPVSAHTGAGLAELRAAIRQALLAALPDEVGVVAGTAQRCHDSVRLAGESLARSAAVQAAGAGDELLAVELRTALHELGKVAGAVYTDDVLDRIFGRFCIGK